MKTVVSERGQITLPKKIRSLLGIRAGTIIDFEIEGSRIVGRKKEIGDPISRWRGRCSLPDGIADVDLYLDEVRG